LWDADRQTVSDSVPLRRETETVDISNALVRLMARFEALARSACRARGLSLDEVDEVLQDVRIRLWKSQVSRENLERVGASYLVRVVRSAVIDRLRRQQRRRDMSLDAMADAASIPNALQVAPVVLDQRQALAARMERALSTLPQNRRLVVQLHLEGYERPEIVGMTGWTEAKVRNLLYRGLDDLRAQLRADGEHSDD
jgi:RNA polymerase sigma-70 factor (ECF subfamily)